MEQREEIKDGVKQRIIEFMAEQITKEESFIDLKSELVSELFKKKESKIQVSQTTEAKDLDTFSKVSVASESALEKIKEKQASYYKKILDVKLGRGTNENVQKLIKELRDKDSSTYSDVLEQLNGNKLQDYKEFIIDPRLRGELPNEKQSELRASSLTALADILSNPFSKTLDMSVQSYTNEENYYKTYSVNDKIQNFKFDCSYVYNNTTKQTYFDRFQVDSKGFLLFGEELGIQFALDAIALIDQAESIKDEAISLIEKRAEGTNIKKKQVKGKK
jgi:hypothetical protein